MRGSTLQFNPTFDAKIIERRLLPDRAALRRRVQSEWRDDLATSSAARSWRPPLDTDVIVRPPQEGVQYFAFDDPSGGANNSYTLAIAHPGCARRQRRSDLLFSGSRH